jgi:predicted RNA-binding protein with PIN domain
MATIDDLSVLANVIMAARFVLRDSEPDEIPNKLQGAASGTGKRLPPPHQRAVLAHIEADETFRESVREHFEDSDFDDPLGLEYLADPASASPKVELAVAYGTVRDLEAAVDAEKARTVKAEHKLAETKTRAATAKKEAASKLSARSEADKRSRAGLEKSARESEARAESEAAASAGLGTELGAKEAEIAKLQSKIAKLNEKLAKRKGASSAPASMRKSRFASDPVEIARDLDSQERRLRTYREAHHDSQSKSAPTHPFAVPSGISSADAAAIDALIPQTPERVIIDGYNVSGVVNPEQFATREARDDVVNRAAKLVRETSAVVVVVFDAQESIDGTAMYTSADGVEVVFEGDTIADDTIAEMTHEVSDRCIVITNDRELHNRVRQVGCVPIFSSAFVSWTEHLNRS